jgi:hypothetical protein
MLRLLWKSLKWFVFGLVTLAVLLLAPVAYIELGCRQSSDNITPYAPIITDPKFQRNEAATFLTYPEWHIVHAYDNYAKVISTGDPHDFQFLKSIAGFWSSACKLTKLADSYGGADQQTRSVIYVIGVSFTAEFGAKALYEETFGRLFTILRGDTHSTLDITSAEMAAIYAKFLQQVPWYKYDFPADRAVLKKRSDGSLRDRERTFALGIEFATKAAYAKVIAQAVAATEVAKLRIRSVVSGLTQEQLLNIEGITVLGTLPGGTLIETPRYRAFTRILEKIALQGGEIKEIAGNNDIMLSALSEERQPSLNGIQIRRQGYDDFRYLYWVPLTQLGSKIREFEASKTIRLEHIYDY